MSITVKLTDKGFDVTEDQAFEIGKKAWEILEKIYNEKYKDEGIEVKFKVAKKDGVA